MRIWIAVFVAMLSLGVSAPSASARVVEETAQAGSPVLQLDIPDAWTTFSDPSGNLIVRSNGPSGVAFSLSVVPEQRSLDAVMTEVWASLNATAQRTGDATISDYPGGTYAGTFPHPAGIVLNLETIAAHADGRWVVSATLVYAPSTPPASLDEARAILQSVRIRW